MKLKSALKRRSVAELVKIAEAWGLDGATPPADAGRDPLVDRLYPRLQAKGHFQHLWQQLSEGRQRLVTFLAIHGGDLGLRELARRCFNGDQREARQGLAPLIECGLVYRDSPTSALVGDDVYGLPDLLLRHIEIFAHYQGYLGTFLRDLSPAELKRIAEGLGLPLKSTQSDYLRHVLRHSLLRPSRLQGHLRDLPAAEREIFHAVVRRGGVCIYGELIDLGLQRHCDHSKIDLLNHLLKSTGLLFIAAQGDNKYSNLLMVPKDIVRVVRSGWREDRRSLGQLDSATGGGRHTPSAVLDSGAQILRDLVIFIADVREGGVKRLTNGGIGKNDLKRILPRLSPGKNLKYARFLGLCATELGLLVAEGDTWTVAEHFEQWISNPTQDYADLLRQWVRTPGWNEEYFEGDVAHCDTPVANLLDIAQFRLLVLESLLELPHGEWVEFRAFADIVLPRVAVSVPRRAQRAHGKFNRPPFYIAESIIADSLQWLGVVAIAAEQRSHLETIQSRGNLPVGGPRRRLRQRLKTTEDNHLLFRITDLGRAALGLLVNGAKGETPDVEPLRFSNRQFTVQPNHELLAPPDLALAPLNQLLMMSEIRSTDVVMTLAITRESVRRALDHGWSPEAIVAVLAEGSTTPLPQTIPHLVEECARRRSGLPLGLCGGFLTIDDPVAMAEIRNGRRLQPMIREVIGERTILFQPHVDVAKIAREIERLGYTVHVDSEAAVPTEAGKLSLALAEREMLYLIAALRFTAGLEQELKTDLSESRLRAMIKKIQPEGPRFDSMRESCDTLTRQFRRRHAQALKRRIDDATELHRRQVEKLMGDGPTRPRARFAHDGPNPAKRPKDIRALIEFAIEHESTLAIRFKENGRKTPRRDQITPESIEDDRVYALSAERDTHTLLRLDRIVEAKLV